ncbi:MAG: 30S ribosomal protein S21 [Patescibacteria group bacterium]|nr:30S ribosomal protein S21 [Patescibacteria group bacterium]MDD5121420.1 30S ribosomal protein S21 [Patescibacteria group bacterium]MDD5221894.1 30S ribosomal protein S21 [Patescibacteria group bacterium]MDD5395661.1 30S ribosomal protein S21 [Patescibacteria group bacterium]
MTIEVKKKAGESTEGMIRRFNQSVVRSGLVKEVKGRRFRSRTTTSRARKISALRRKSDQAKREFLIKTGALKS